MSGTAANTLAIHDLDVPGYERVKMCEETHTGLRAIISVHSTTLGPALGGTRFRAYPDDDAALSDVKRLSEGMTYKAAAAGLDLGGGKAVIIGDSTKIKTVELLRAYGRFVDSLNGMYITAADVGTSSDDLDVIGRFTMFAMGKSVAAGGLGDSGHSTALGVLAAMRSAVDHVLKRPLAGLTVGVEGAGKVGSRLVEFLLNDGARVRVSETHPPTREKLAVTYPDVEIVEDLFGSELDVYAPCALGATLTYESAQRLTAQLVCGAANNQLLSADVIDTLSGRGVVWVPDYIANAGGLIQVDGERTGRSLNDVHRDVNKLGQMVTHILDRVAARRDLTTAAAARSIVEERLAVGR